MGNDHYVEDAPNYFRWIKILGWRNNGDGIGQGKNGLIEDCFIRTQDDATYIRGHGVRRVVYWQDVNGSTFVLTPIGALLPDDENIPLYEIVYLPRVRNDKVKYNHLSIEAKKYHIITCNNF